MKAYVLAAGYGTRLGELGKKRAKALLEVGDRPILSHILGRIEALEGLDGVVLVTNARFAPDFQTWKSAYTGPLSVSILDDGTTTAETRLGALADLQLALEQEPPGEDGLLVVAGDNLLEFDLQKAHRHFLASGRPTLVVRQREPEAPGASRYNAVTLDDAGHVTHFEEKPEAPKSPLAAIALYFLPTTAVAFLDRYLASGGNRDAPGNFIAWLVQETAVDAVPLTGEWHDIGDPESLARAQGRFAPTKPGGTHSGEAP